MYFTRKLQIEVKLEKNYRVSVEFELMTFAV